MGNSISQYPFQQPEPLNVVVASDNAPNNSNNVPGNVHNNNRALGNVMINMGGPPQAVIARRGILEGGDNLFGTIRNDLASYFPFGRLAPPPPIHHTNTVKSLVNLHKDSVVLLRDDDSDGDGSDGDGDSDADGENGENKQHQHLNGTDSPSTASPSSSSYRLFFKFDALEACDITVFVGHPHLRQDNDSADGDSNASGSGDAFEFAEDKEKIMIQVGPLRHVAGTGQTFKHPKDQAIPLSFPLNDQAIPLSFPLEHLPTASSAVGQPSAVEASHTEPSTSKQAPSTLFHQYQIPVILRLDVSGCTFQANDTCNDKLSEKVNDNKANDNINDKANEKANDKANEKANDKDVNAKQLPIQHQTTCCTLLACGDGSFVLKVVQQKIHHQGKTYVVHDIFGLDHTGERESEGTRECVVCMSEPRDTTVLPCRHLCVCATCADLMRVQTNKCPICRAPVSSLLKITLSKDSYIVNKEDSQRNTQKHGVAAVSEGQLAESRGQERQGQGEGQENSIKGKEDDEDEDLLISRRDNNTKGKNNTALP